ncbi:hypothetical protein GCM10007928_48650 [Sulfitobacter porphyrae]|nr:hypothetical protein GCM10007928_48650 [Sulfitobacter porphyrae]
MWHEVSVEYGYEIRRHRIFCKPVKRVVDVTRFLPFVRWATQIAYIEFGAEITEPVTAAVVANDDFFVPVS